MRSPLVPISFAIVLSTTSLLSGCSSPCDSSESTVRYTGGFTNAAHTYYESGASDEPFLEFPAGRRLELPHGLDDVPDYVNVYVAFDAKPSSFSIAAGNEALIDVDRDVVTVKNDTCSTFYVRVVAGLASGTDGGTPSDAGSNDGG